MTVGISESATRFNGAQYTFNTVSSTDYTKTDEPYRSGQRLSLQKVTSDLAIDLHASLSTALTSQTVEFETRGPPPESIRIYAFDFRAVEVGLGITYAIDDNWWVPPWIGLAHAGSVAGLAVGASLGADVFANEHHRVAVFVHATYSKLRSGDEPGDKYGEGASLAQFGAGIA